MESFSGGARRLRDRHNLAANLLLFFLGGCALAEQPECLLDADCPLHYVCADLKNAPSALPPLRYLPDSGVPTKSVCIPDSAIRADAASTASSDRRLSALYGWENAVDSAAMVAGELLRSPLGSMAVNSLGYVSQTDPLYSQRAGFHSSQGSHYDDGRNSGASYPVRSSPRLPHLYPPTVPTVPSPEQLQTLVIEGSQQLAYPSVSVHSSPAYEPAPAPGLLRAVLRDTLSVGSTAMHRPRSPNSRPGMGDALLSDIGVIQRLQGPRMDYPTEERAEPWGRPPEYPTPVLSAYPTPDRMRNAQQAVSPPADPETQSASRPSPEKDLPSVVRSDTPSRDGVAVMREATSSWLQAEIGKALEEKKRIREEASVSTADTVRRETEGLLPSLFSIDVANAALAGVMIECKNPVRSLALGTTTTFNLSGIDNDVYQVFFSGHTSSARDIIVEVWNSAGLPYGPNTQALCSELGTSELKFFIVGKLKEVLLPKLIYFCPATIDCTSPPQWEAPLIPKVPLEDWFFLQRTINNQ